MTSIIALISQGSSGAGSIDWTDLGPFGVAIVIAWFLLNRSDKVVEREKDRSEKVLQAEKAEAERDLARAQSALETERASHEETRKLLYERLRLESLYLMDPSDETEG